MSRSPKRSSRPSAKPSGARTPRGPATAAPLPTPPRRRPPRWLTFAIPAAVAVVLVWGAILAFTTWRDGRALQAHLTSATQQLERGDWDGAQRTFQTMAELSRRASARVGGPLGKPFAVVPVVGHSVRTARAILDAGAAVSELAAQTLPEVRDRTFWRQGQIDTEALRSLRPTVEASVATLERARADLERSPSSPLPGPLARARETLHTRLSDTERNARTALLAIDLSERVLGAQGERRYFIAFENLAETRGAGGLWGNYGVLVARDGRLGLGRFGRLQAELGSFARYEGPTWYQARYERFGASHDWAQLPTAPDFPTVASMAETNLRAAEGIGPVDGVIAVDTRGMEALLRITGPVTVPSWPEPLDSDNVTRVSLHDAYSHFEANEARISFLSDTAVAVWSKLLTTDISLQALASSGLGEAVREKHFRLHFARAEEQRLVEQIGAGGALGGASKTIALVTQNTSGHKMDYWLHRRLDLVLRLRADGGASGEATVRLTNRGPASGEPRDVIGPHDPRFRRGWNVQLIRLYLPSSASVVATGPDRPGIGSELDYVVAEWEVEVPPGQRVSRTLRFDLVTAWEPGSSSISLLLRRQPFLHPDELEVAVVPPRGRRVLLSQDWNCSGGRTKADVEIEGVMRTWLPGWLVGLGSGADPCA